MQRVLFIALCAFVTGCASQKPSKIEPRLHSMQRRLKQQATVIQDLKERNLVLEKRQQLRAVATENKLEEKSFVTSEAPAELPGSFQSQANAAPIVKSVAKAGALPVVKLPTQLPAKVQQAPPLISVSQDETGEHFLYSKILETYRSKNAEELDRTLQLLLKSYPESTFADDAIYMSGLLNFENQDYALALKSFDRVLRDYPRSNKAVAALFAKASIEKRTGHAHEAKRGFLQIKDLFPGSPEAARVSVELKLLESASLKRREL